MEDVWNPITILVAQDELNHYYPFLAIAKWSKTNNFKVSRKFSDKIRNIDKLVGFGEEVK